MAAVRINSLQQAFPKGKSSSTRRNPRKFILKRLYYVSDTSPKLLLTSLNLGNIHTQFIPKQQQNRKYVIFMYYEYGKNVPFKFSLRVIIALEVKASLSTQMFVPMQQHPTRC